jgi:hypothetical protein
MSIKPSPNRASRDFWPGFLPRFLRDFRQVPRTSGFTIVEVLIVITIMIFILAAVYKIFTSQVRMVSTNIDMMKVNDDFRRVHVFLNNDIRESTMITFPPPVKLKGSQDLVTPKAPCTVLRLVKQEINPAVPFVHPPVDTVSASSTFGQVVRVSEILYELRPFKPDEDGESSSTSVPRFKLFRSEFTRDNTSPNQIVKQETEITDAIRDFVLFRTIRQPMMTNNITGKDDRLLTPFPATESGTGHNLVHLRITLERKRTKQTGDLYEISLATCYYKRGREVYYYQ